MRALDEEPVDGSPTVTRPPPPEEAPMREDVRLRTPHPLTGKPRRARAKRSGPKFAVLGAGHGGLAMAGHLALMGFRVDLWNRSPARVEHLQMRGAIELEGGITGEGRLERATTNLK